MSPADAWPAEDAARIPEDADISVAAFEFLRRNPAYIEDFDRIAARKTPDRKEETVTAQRWGLRFPCRSLPAGTRSKNHLAG